MLGVLWAGKEPEGGHELPEERDVKLFFKLDGQLVDELDLDVPVPETLLFPIGLEIRSDLHL